MVERGAAAHSGLAGKRRVCGSMPFGRRVGGRGVAHLYTEQSVAIWPVALYTMCQWKG